MTVIKLKDNLSDYHELIQYPDGQKSIKLHLDKLNIKEAVQIICRIKNFDELGVLSCLIAALRHNDFLVQEVHFVYLFGLRSDRAFSKGEPNYLRDVLAPIINSLNIPKIGILYPHGYLTSHIKNSFHGSMNIDFGDDVFFIGGDESFGNNMENKLPFFIKKRTDTGIKVNLPKETLDFMYTNPEIKHIQICDDLCDGGATFIAEAKYLKECLPDVKLSLFVAHGLFTKGFDELNEYFDKIITTNSYKNDDHYPAEVKVIDVWGTKNAK